MSSMGAINKIWRNKVHGAAPIKKLGLIFKI